LPTADGRLPAAALNYFNYFTEIEDAFVRRRGKHLLLSPMDWALIESWKAMGVPLHVALRGIEKSFDSFESKPRRRSVKSLLYCQEEVEAQFAEWRESQVGKPAGVEAGAAAGVEAGGKGATAASSGEAAGNGARGVAVDEEGGPGAGLPFPRELIAAHLASCRAELEGAREARLRAHGEDALAEALARAAARLEELERDFAAAARPDAERLEASLTDLEAMLDRAVRAATQPERIDAHRAEAAEQLHPYRARMAREVFEQTLDNLLAKRLREDSGVPRLSLFYL
jgi:hypothetical protein